MQLALVARNLDDPNDMIGVISKCEVAHRCTPPDTRTFLVGNLNLLDAAHLDYIQLPRACHTYAKRLPSRASRSPRDSGKGNSYLRLKGPALYITTHLPYPEASSRQAIQSSAKLGLPVIGPGLGWGPPPTNAITALPKQQVAV